MAQFIECTALEAVMDNDEATARKLIDEMFIGEAEVFRGYIIKLRRIIDDSIDDLG